MRAGAALPPVGTVFSFTLNEPAKVSLAFTQKLTGRKVNHRCVAQTHGNRHKPTCTRTATTGTLSFTGHKGLNKVSFDGRTSGSQKLPPGRYTLLITPRASGKTSGAARLTFTTTPTRTDGARRRPAHARRPISPLRSVAG